jgi:hypothetical protein
MDAQRREQLEAQLSAYLDDELTARERAEVEAFLAGDGEARKLLAELEATVAVVQSLPRAKATDDLFEGIRARMEKQALLGEPGRTDADAGGGWNVRPWAAAAVIALTVTAGYVMWPARETAPIAVNIDERTLALNEQSQDREIGLLFDKLDEAPPADAKDKAAGGAPAGGVADGTLLADAEDGSTRALDVSLNRDESRLGNKTGDLKQDAPQLTVGDDHLTLGGDLLPGSAGDARLKADLGRSDYADLAKSAAETPSADGELKATFERDADAAGLPITDTTLSGENLGKVDGASDPYLPTVNGTQDALTFRSEPAEVGGTDNMKVTDALVVGTGAGYDVYRGGHVTREGIETPEKPARVVVELAFQDAHARLKAMDYLQTAWGDAEPLRRRAVRPSKGGVPQEQPAAWSWFASVDAVDVVVNGRNADSLDGVPPPQQPVAEAAPAESDESAAAGARILHAEGRMDRESKAAPPTEELAHDFDERGGGEISGHDASGRLWQPAEIDALAEHVEACSVELRGVTAEDHHFYHFYRRYLGDRAASEEGERRQEMIVFGDSAGAGDKSSRAGGYGGGGLGGFGGGRGVGGFGGGTFGMTTQPATDGPVVAQAETDGDGVAATGTPAGNETRVRERSPAESAKAPPTTPAARDVMTKGGPTSWEGSSAPGDAPGSQQEQYSEQGQQQPEESKDYHKWQKMDSGAGGHAERRLEVRQQAANQAVPVAEPASASQPAREDQSSSLSAGEDHSLSMTRPAFQPASQPARYRLQLYLTLAPEPPAAAAAPSTRPAQDTLQTEFSQQTTTQPAAP